MLFLLAGPNPDASVANLLAWIDTEAALFGIGHSMVHGPNGRVPGLFHMMSVNEESRFRSFLGAKLEQWSAEAVMNNMSCGWMIEVAGGSGSGRGQLIMTVHHLGPFRG